MMRQTLATGLAVAGTLALGACASTTWTSTWRAPDAQAAHYKGQKIVALVLSKDESVRRGAEWELAKALKSRGVDAVPAYSIVPADETRDKDKARARFEQIGAMGVVVMRVTAQEKEYNETTGGWTSPYYTNFWGDYYDYGWGSIYAPSYLKIDTLFHVETLVYNLKQGKLIWAGKSKTVNPTTAEALIKDLVSSVAAEMEKAGLLKG
jgi:hypothetical protein